MTEQFEAARVYALDHVRIALAGQDAFLVFFLSAPKGYDFGLDVLRAQVFAHTEGLDAHILALLPPRRNLQGGDNLLTIGGILNCPVQFLYANLLAIQLLVELAEQRLIAVSKRLGHFDCE